jgi:glycosyltransferase involved in cell wall biosynthesis
MLKVCFIDDQRNTPAPPFIQEALEELACQVETFYLSDGNGNPLRHSIEAFQPDLILTFQNVGLLANDTLTSPAISSIPKALFFFDEPASSYSLFGKKHPLISQGKAHGVYYFVWDGYWRRHMKQLAHWDCHPIHLAADVKYFSPKKKDLIPQIREYVVFLGNIPSQRLLDKIREELPAPYQKAAIATLQKIQEGPYALNPFAALEDAISQLPSFEREVITHETDGYLNSTPDLQKPLAPHIQLRRLAWQYGKRETRLRALRAAISAAPLAILSNLKVDGIAGQDELTHELKASHNTKPVFVDSSQASFYQLAHLYASGFLHFQSTDPQSVEGGIPYRVFQTAACAVPLVSDYKLELAQCFAPDEEMLFYRSPDELGTLLSNALSNRRNLQDMGQAAYKRFLKQHTWIHRMRSVLQCVDLKNSKSQPFGHKEAQKF